MVKTKFFVQIISKETGEVLDEFKQNSELAADNTKFIMGSMLDKNKAYMKVVEK